MSSILTVLLATGAAFFYMAASWAMKAWGGSSLSLLIPAVLAILALGALFEIEVLKVSRLGHVIVMVLAIEMVMTFTVSTMLLGERYAVREIAGVAIILGGLLLLNWPKDTMEKPPATANMGELALSGDEQAPPERRARSLSA